MGTAAGGEVLLGKYELGRLLGRGSFAKVYKARSVAGDVAIKVINKTNIANTTMAPRILREVSLMRRINHPNVVKLHEVMATKSKIYMVMELAPGGELLAKVSGRAGRSPLSEPVARKYIQQLVSALHFCHSNGVSHRDVKPQNLLLDGDGNLKVSDFGLSALPEQIRDDGLLHTACGTPAYTAPEVVRRKGYDGAKADAWSCGVILFFLLAGHLPFDDANLNIMYRKIHRREYDFPAWFSPAVRRVVARLLDPNPDTRMTIEALMHLSWFKKSYQPVTNASFDCPFKDGKSETSPVLHMNAFDIISLSSGLDLSGLFEGGKKKEKRFTSTASPEKIAERTETMGEKLGYRVERRKCGSIGLAKTGLVVSVEVQEMAPSLFLVGMKAYGGDQEREMEDLKSGLEDIVLDWINDGI